jgi:hypothetical protein
VRQRAHLVGLVHPDDVGHVREVAEIGHGAHRPAGWNSGSCRSLLQWVKVNLLT